MVEKFQDQLYQLENKQAKLHANIRWELEDKKCSKIFFEALERQNMKDQTLSKLYTDDNNSKYY